MMSYVLPKFCPKSVRVVYRSLVCHCCEDLKRTGPGVLWSGQGREQGDWTQWGGLHSSRPFLQTEWSDWYCAWIQY
jgi:hypothetical protein